MIPSEPPNEVAPTVADEASAFIDDAHVISKTLPIRRGRLRDPVHLALNVMRGHVIEQPLLALLLAGIGGVVLSAVVITACATTRDGPRDI
ncbi:hypothetical protein J7E62_01650 [Variovorax paradoxus]|nr:hypothetical protein [Variovorax paradoxus]